MAFAAAFLVLSLRGQDNSAILDRIAGKLEEAASHLPLEMVSIQTDKDIYAPGEIIWFSNRVEGISDAEGTVVSRSMTVGLYDQEGILVKSDAWRLAGGGVSGDLPLPDDLLPGRYYLAAYTPLQSDPGQVAFKPLLVDRCYESDAVVGPEDPQRVYAAGEEARIVLNVNDYEGNPVQRFPLDYQVRHNGKILGSGKLRSSDGKAVIRQALPAETGSEPVELIVSHPRGLWSRTYSLRTTADRITLVFYPEGGHLLGTVPQKVGYHATVWNGVPVGIEGDIVDAAGQLTGKTKTFMPGYGVFPYRSGNGQSGRLVVTSAHGRGQEFLLPTTGEQKVALAFRSADAEAVTADLLVAGSEPRVLSVTATRGHVLLWAATMELSASGRVKIPAAELAGGVVLLSVFDAEGILLSSRLVNVPSPGRLNLKIDAVATGGETVNITIRSTDKAGKELPARLVLSVADRMRTAEGFSDFPVEFAPGMGLKNPHPPQVAAAGDSLGAVFLTSHYLLCNRLTGFSWDAVLQPSDHGETDSGLNHRGLCGVAVDKKGNPVAYAKVSVMDALNMGLLTETADEQGRFCFAAADRNLVAGHTLLVTDEQGKGSYSAVLDPSFEEKLGLCLRGKGRIYEGLAVPKEQAASYLAANPDLLFPQPAPRPVASRRNETYKTMLQSSSSILDAIRAIKPYTIESGQIVFFGTVNSIHFQSGALIVIDGQKMGTQADILNSISPFDVEEINVSLDPIDIQKYTGLNSVGVIEITTKSGKSSTAASPSAERRSDEPPYSDGYRVPRSFLTGGVLPGKKGKDLRTTLYWDPYLETGPGGTTTFSIPLSQVKSDFVVAAKVMTETGSKGEQRVQFRIP